jgi:hypothetical protein
MTISLGGLLTRFSCGDQSAKSTKVGQRRFFTCPSFMGGDGRPVLFLANAPSWVGSGWPRRRCQSSDRSWGLVANLKIRDPEESGVDPEMNYKSLLLFSAVKDVSLSFKCDRRMRQQPGMLMRQYPLYRRSAIAELVKCCGDTIISARDGQ